MRALPRERLQMMHLEVARLRAALTSLIDVRATPAIPPIYLPSFSRRNVSTALARRLGRFVATDDSRDALARCF